MPNIVLNFENVYGILFFACLAFPVLFFYNAKISFSKDTYGCSSENSKQLQGIFIIIVVFHHIAQRLSSNALIMLESVGHLAVGVFFILSGYGLIKSLHNKKNYLEKFIYSKILLLVFPFFVINFLTVVVLHLFGHEYRIYEGIKYLLSISLVDTRLWFILSIFIFYCLFFISFKLFSGVKALICLFALSIIYVFVCKSFSFNSWIYTSSLCFPVGVAFGFYENRLSDSLHHWVAKAVVFGLSVMLVLFLLLFPSAPYVVSLIAKSIFFSVAVLIVFSIVSLKSSFALFFGGLSLEIYLLHMKLLLVFAFFTNIDSGVWLICYLGLLSVLALYFKKINFFCFRKIQESKAKFFL